MAEPIAYGADWSARPISGDILAAFRYTDRSGNAHPLSLVLRYANFPGQRLSYITRDEYESHLKAGIRSLLIYQRYERDPDGGEPRGREFGRAAVAYAREIGYRPGEPIFATADRPAGEFNLDVVEKFFAGFAVEVRAAGFLAGGYGFWDVIYRLQNENVVDVLWLCGDERNWREGIHLYQWNNGRIYPGGVESDLVKQFEKFGEDDVPMSKEEREALAKEIRAQVVDGMKYEVLGPAHDTPGAFIFDGADGAKRGIVDMLRQSNANEFALEGMVKLLLQEGGHTVEELARALAPAVSAGVVNALPKDAAGNLLVDVNENQIATEVLRQFGNKFSQSL